MFDTLERITELRKARGLSVYKMAKLSGIPQSTIATWYQKQLCPPIDKLEKLCNTFNITLSDFFQLGMSRELSDEELMLIDKWAALNSKQKDAVLSVIDAF